MKCHICKKSILPVQKKIELRNPLNLLMGPSVPDELRYPSKWNHETCELQRLKRSAELKRDRSLKRKER